MEKVDVIVVGAGVVGLACARALAVAGREVIVAERETVIGSGVSARNSGVIHAGIYYPHGSLKARLCVRGRELLYAYARDRGVAHERCEKLIVAAALGEVDKLANIQAQAAANGASDLRLISAAEAKAMEPEVACAAALLSPSTGIIDVHGLMDAYVADIEAAGGAVALANGIDSGAVADDGFALHLVDGWSFHARTLINAAGLDAPGFARRVRGLNPATVPRQYRAKGNYFGVSGRAPFQRLIYPVPIPGGLGTHFTRNLAGESLFGPDVEWISDEGPIDYAVDPARAGRFVEAVRRYWPGVEDRELLPAYSGVRPKLKPQGTGESDFMIRGPAEHGVSGLVNLYGIESPGLTASLAIGEAVAAMLA